MLMLTSDLGNMELTEPQKREPKSMKESRTVSRCLHDFAQVIDVLFR
jgi:hypothetical protein